MITKGLGENGRKEIPNEAITRCWRLLPSDRSGVVGLQFPSMTLHRALSGFSLKTEFLREKRGKSQMKSGVCVCVRVCTPPDKHTTRSAVVAFVLLSYIIPTVSKCNTITPSLLRKPEMFTKIHSLTHTHTHTNAQFTSSDLPLE